MPRHLLFLTTDQHRHDFATGGAVPSLTTPHLDRLRAEGTTFQNAYATCPVCMPARFAWLHGFRPSQFSPDLVANARDWPAPGRWPSLPARLRDAGYHTALIGKLHPHAGLFRHDLTTERATTRARGFDDVIEVSGKMLAWWFDCDWTRHLADRGLLDTYRATYRPVPEIFNYATPTPGPLARADTMDGFIADHAASWLRRHDPARPFFLHVSLCGPHFPLDAPPEYLARFRTEDMPPPEGVTDPAEVIRWQHIRRAYCALTAQVDDEIGRVLDALKDAGLADDTLVIHCTDHGDMLGHRGRGHKNQPYDTACRTPVTVRCPGVVPAGVSRTDFIESIDVPFTFLAAAGLDPRDDPRWQSSPAQSFWDAARTGAPTPRDHVYSEGNGWRMVRRDDWKYVRRRDGADELYHLGEDPWELHNRAADPDLLPMLADLRARLVDELLRGGAVDLEPRPAPRDDWLERELASRPRRTD